MGSSFLNRRENPAVLQREMPGVAVGFASQIFEIGVRVGVVWLRGLFAVPRSHQLQNIEGENHASLARAGRQNQPQGPHY
jgi:hypothetical protein